MVAPEASPRPPKGASAFSATLIPHSSSSLTASPLCLAGSVSPLHSSPRRPDQAGVLISTALVFRSASKRGSSKSKLQEQGESRLQGPRGATPVYTGVTLTVRYPVTLNPKNSPCDAREGKACLTE